MTDLQKQFQEETNLIFDGIPINGAHFEYITWLEAQILALRIHDVVKSFGCGWSFCDAVLDKQGTVKCGKCNRYD